MQHICSKRRSKSFFEKRSVMCQVKIPHTKWYQTSHYGHCNTTKPLSQTDLTTLTRIFQLQQCALLLLPFILFKFFADICHISNFICLSFQYVHTILQNLSIQLVVYSPEIHFHSAILQKITEEGRTGYLIRCVNFQKPINNQGFLFISLFTELFTQSSVALPIKWQLWANYHLLRNKIISCLK